MRAMRRLIGAGIVVGITLAIGAGEAGGAAGRVGGDGRAEGVPSLPYVGWAGHETGRQEKGFVLVRDAAAWRALWAEHAGVRADGGALERHAIPRVNFGACVVLAHFAEPTVNTDGEVVREIVERGGELVVRYEQSAFGTFGPGGGGVRTEPWGMWVLPRPQGVIVVEEGRRRLKTEEPTYREVKRFPAVGEGPGARGDEGGAADEAGDAPAWVVTGVVTDEAGRPLEGVVVVAHAGVGTLRPTGRAVTGEDGSYELRFGPGMMFMGDHSGLQAATISPRMRGRVERNLHRQGDLLMASREPPEEDLDVWGKGPVVLPERPARVDFVMVPAAAVMGRVVDGEGRPLAGWSVWVDAEELPPSSSVLASGETDAAGRFRFGELPAGEVWFAVRDPGNRRAEVESGRVVVEAGREVEVELVVGGGGVEVRE